MTYKLFIHFQWKLIFSDEILNFKDHGGTIGVTLLYMISVFSSTHKFVHPNFGIRETSKFLGFYGIETGIPLDWDRFFTILRMGL